MATSDKSLVCPLSRELFREPVVAQDGYTYEREAIENWIRKNGTSPKTGQPLSLAHLYPNNVVKDLVSTFETSLLKKDYHFVLNVDVKRKKGRPLFQTTGKALYHAEWLPADSNKPEIIILKIDGARAMREASFYVNLTRHPHVVRTFGFVVDKKKSDDDSDDNDKNSIMLVQEYASEGSLYELLEQQDTVPDENILVEIFLQIIDAMIFLAYNHVIHGDLACRNVLVFRFDETNPKNIIVKVTDFGLSRQSTLYSKTSGSLQTTLDIVPTRYAAPEILSGGKSGRHTEKSDVYSMGVLMWETYSQGALPWSKIQNDPEVILNVINSVLLPKPSKCSTNYWNIITKTWSKLPDDRPKFEQLKHLLMEQVYLTAINSSNEQRSSGSDSTLVKVERANETLASQPATSNKATIPAVSLTDPDEKREYIFKILVIGEPDTGKTAYIKRYVYNAFSRYYQATIGLDFALKIVKYDDNTILRLQFWDIQGQERQSGMTRVYYKEAVGCFIVFDVTRGPTFEAVTKWKTDLDSKVQLPDGNLLPCVLLANKCDLPKEALINNARHMDRFCEEKGFVKWFETSAKENINIEAPIRFLISEIMKHTEQLTSRSLDKQRSDTLNILDKPKEKMSDKEKSWC